MSNQNEAPTTVRFTEVTDQTTSTAGPMITAIHILPKVGHVTLGQTFTVGITGRLVQVNFIITSAGTSQYPLVARLVKCTDIVNPSLKPEDLIAQREFTPAELNTPGPEYPLTLQCPLRLPEAYEATEGEILALVLHSDNEYTGGTGASYGWNRFQLPAYQRGYALTHKDSTDWQLHGNPGTHFVLSTQMIPA